MIIDLIRHTTPAIEPGICYGQTDLDLKDTFESEFDTVHGKLTMNYDAIISSPLQRCLKLAKTIEQAVESSSLTLDPRIMEYNFGDWELKPWSELKSEQAKVWMDNFVDQPAPKGDSIIIMRERVLNFWEELLAQDYSHVAVVTHSGVQRLLHAEILETPLNRMFRLELDFGAVMRVTHNNQTKLTTVKHL